MNQAGPGADRAADGDGVAGSGGSSAPHAYVSRGGLKLRHALDTFGIDPAGTWCADLGCSTGGFTDCLLRAGAAAVWAVDTGYGVLAWSLRTDARVRTLERTNALHAPVPAEVSQRPGGAGVDLVVADASWTPQRLLVPAALRWLRPGGGIVTLVKPHYEDQSLARRHGGRLPDDEAQRVAMAVADSLPLLAPVQVLGLTPSPIRGSSGTGRSANAGSGNLEWLAWLKPAGSPPAPAG